MTHSEIDIGINHLPSREKAGRKAWRLNVHYAGGKSEHFKTKEEAVLRRNELLGTSVESGQSEKTFGACAVDLVARYKWRYDNPEDTMKFTTYKEAMESARFWGKFFDDMALNDISADLIEETIKGLTLVRKPKTILNRWSFFKNVFKRAHGRKQCSHNPCDAISISQLIGSTKAMKQPAVRYSKDVVAKIIESAGKWSLHIKFAAKTGLRSGEQRGLCWRHIDFDAGFVTVEQAALLAANTQWEVGQPKSAAAYRNVPISDELLAELREWRLKSNFSTDDDFVFPNENGDLLAPHRLNGELERNEDGSRSNRRNRGALKPACFRAGVDVIRWHDLRHHYASLQLYRDGISLQEVAALLGHENSKITENVYGHWIDGANKDQDLRRRAAV